MWCSWNLWLSLTLSCVECVGRTKIMFDICSQFLCVSFVLQTWPGFFLSEPHSFPPTMPELEFGVVWSDAQGQEVVWIYLQLLFNFQPPSEKSWRSFLEVTSLIMMNQLLFWLLPCVWLIISSLGLDGWGPGLFLVLCCDLMRLFYLIWSSCLQLSCVLWVSEQ